MNSRPEDSILARYDQALGEFGDTPQGAMWPDAAGRATRYDVMLDLLEARPAGNVVLCDLGCGTGGLLERIRERGMTGITYVGIDRSRLALEHARGKFPGAAFHELDVNADGADLGLVDCDYLVANGLFTVKHDLSHAQMQSFVESTIRSVWPRVRRGLAFNVMSKVVDWEREDLFHAPMDDMAALLHPLAGRRVRMRADYGLYEYTCYAFREDVAVSSDVLPDRIADANGPVRVLRPLLPRAEKLLPYLRRIDASRIYSNFGPLVLEFEARLSRHFQQAEGSVVSANTGTAGLVGSILATAGRARPERPLALMPALTFVATAVAAQECGFRPCLVDVEADSWLLDADKMATHPRLDQVGVVIPVAAFGRPVEQAPWLAFRERTGIPVVIDGAASFEALELAPEAHLGPIPVMISLHATKSLATAEGGCVVCSDIELATRIGQALNYGFHFSRDSRTASTNGKMSEYHAAIGLAELDDWRQKQAAFARVVACYHRHVAGTPLEPMLFTAPDVCSSYVLLRCHDGVQAHRVQQSLDRNGVEYRHWYGQGLHHQSYYADSLRDALPVTDAITPCLLGLPMAPDLDEQTVARVVRALHDGLVAE
ncbi:MAG: DegT/DnrJ/EryC1/StrS family aminotransferase [Gammaproteobacteria bacterium]|nr:DegT/DnrJ/EryC1/StrS family aminotransferase [Gammaproteobacteria bacterium]